MSFPARAVLQYLMRATDAASLRHLEDRMADCFLAGAVATGCDYEIVQTEPPYDELVPDRWLADDLPRRDDTTRPRTDRRRDRGAVPLGSTDMGNVTQVMPGIHPVVGVDAEGASVHQPGFAAAAAGPSGDKAVVEGAIMLARTVVALAESAAERDRVLELRPSGRRHETAQTAADSWLDAHYDDVVAWRRHIHAHPELGRQEFATTQFVASQLADAGLNPKVLPGGTGLICDFGPEQGPRIALRADMDALPMADRTGMPTPRWCPTSRTPAATTRTPRCCSARRSRWTRCPSCRSACG